MKKLILVGAIAISYVLNSPKLFSQTTQSGLGIAGHNALGFPPAYYLGWDAATVIPLEIRHDNNLQIRYFTNGFQRMVTDAGIGGATNGRTAFGNNLAAGFTPLARLHAMEFGAGANGALF